jgi:hypothetical protein
MTKHHRVPDHEVPLGRANKNTQGNELALKIREEA